MISILRARSDQLLNLSRNFKLNFKLTNHAGMKKFIDTNSVDYMIRTKQIPEDSDMDLNRKIFPETFGIKEEQLGTEGQWECGYTRGEPSSIVTTVEELLDPEGTRIVVVTLFQAKASKGQESVQTVGKILRTSWRWNVNLGTEHQAAFRKQAERDGTEVVPSALEAPYQQGLTERAGGVFKNILYKAMLDYDCQTEEEWRGLVDVSCMMRNRLLLSGGYSPIQRVIGYSPRLPGGRLLSGGETDHMVPDLVIIGDAQDLARIGTMKSARQFSSGDEVAPERVTQAYQQVNLFTSQSKLIEHLVILNSSVNLKKLRSHPANATEWNSLRPTVFSYRLRCVKGNGRRLQPKTSSDPMRPDYNRAFIQEMPSSENSTAFNQEKGFQELIPASS
ncbi:hypothetical protein AK812_SmicGene42486 [Symbiodinium microadriaticum]|uniref:Integrase catalytic domain-containing protein n=1 Tax=Symbiodinium microadriaticum TaxID=2951 RepID=A0A1Q9C3F5_SYMMI|nr:hypothetical protein AK812_SmicGene42486 [Symbiodinium microadriaticum]